MRLATLFVVLILVFVGVAGYVLYQKGFLTRETLALFLKQYRHVEEAPPPEEEKTLALAASIHKREQALKEEAEQLKELSSRLEIQRRELAAERAFIKQQLEAVAPSIEGGVRRPSPAEGMTKLTKVYENMPPEEAAAIMENLSDLTVAQLLLNMRARQAAQILGSMNPDKAANTSKLLLPESRANTQSK
ncbi:MAG: hypothetical protein C4532_04560 [Candidatus Abyssobacteria bacterium SURF_17]|uniref:Magnesium transporter MgtE intracellular domain-containing protein n=1 Tax=Candidatus Abyssobacteria bacterium SURF_17 TaxID=2093361 RepID=A0A419F4L1_9BACT|nr:MAG: hypothetical protein C4532_04560 [Candidatus Abyssubacteria bacterium SURF_17]